MVTDVRDVEARYRELEQRREVTLETKVRRGQVGLLLALVVSVLLAGVTAAVDLRRLASPAGTARAWAEATVFGDCSRHLSLSVRAPGDRDRRVPDDVCQALRARSLQARTVVPGTRVTTRLLSRDDDDAVAEAVVTTPDGRTVARLPLLRTGDGWRVVRDDEACRVGCG